MNLNRGITRRIVWANDDISYKNSWNKPNLFISIEFTYSLSSVLLAFLVRSKVLLDLYRTKMLVLNTTTSVTLRDSKVTLSTLNCSQPDISRYDEVYWILVRLNIYIIQYYQNRMSCQEKSKMSTVYIVLSHMFKTSHDHMIPPRPD